MSELNRNLKEYKIKEKLTDINVDLLIESLGDTVVKVYNPKSEYIVIKGYDDGSHENILKQNKESVLLDQENEKGKEFRRKKSIKEKIKLGSSLKAAELKELVLEMAKDLGYDE